MPLLLAANRKRPGDIPQDQSQGEPSMIAQSFVDDQALAGRRSVAGQSELLSTRSSSLSCTLDLSKSRAHDAALDILGAYKLTGNFQVNLEIVLKDLGVFDKVTYQIESNPKLSYYPDCRHVVFRPNDNVHFDMFGEIITSIKVRIGFDAALPWWVRLFR
jgi:hypothetical protein